MRAGPGSRYGVQVSTATQADDHNMCCQPEESHARIPAAGRHHALINPQARRTLIYLVELEHTSKVSLLFCRAFRSIIGLRLELETRKLAAPGWQSGSEPVVTVDALAQAKLQVTGG